MGAEAAQDVDDILQRMRTIRTKLDTEVTGVVQNAKTLVDWRFYFNKAPWACIGAAAAAGYWIVRPKPKSLFVDPDIREALTSKGKMMVQPPRQGVWDTVTGLVISAAVRSAMHFGTRWLGSAFHRESQVETPMETRT
jgi:hypothetical protein